ncbi:hypothetical protein [Roseobacter sp. HKCCA0882]|uniref:hypothetical protein n=1 Tax=Roseobacter sp. HKCCA0882 TaxID=3120337 RepID=UPI0030EB8779
MIVEATFSATMILGGQIKGTSTRLLPIYREGNFVEASDDTPLFQIGAMQYGRPILVRAFDLEMSFEDAVKLLMVSFDSTIKANLSVNLPLNLHVYTADSLKHGKMTRIEKNDPYFNVISMVWGDMLKRAFNSLPPL